MKIRHILSLIALLTVSVAFGKAPKLDREALSRNLNIFSSIFKTLHTTYVDSIDIDKSMNIAIDAMLSSIDPYTEYFPEDRSEDLLSISTGEFGGIGAYIQQNADKQTVVSLPQLGTPAYNAGLKAGDIFETIDGDTVLTIGSDKVRERLRGQAGTPLRVTVRRPYSTDSILSFDLTRAVIDINPVPYYGIVRDSVGYINISTFNNKTVESVKSAYYDLKKQNPDLRGLILDLRSNGGGIMEGAINLVALFVDKGTEVLRTRDRDGNEKVYKTTSRPIDAEIPLAVLIDEGSASSSEITAGALQDLDRAVIVGQRSYGKGLIQSSRPVDYNGLLKITVGKYYIPSGRLIQAIDYSHRNPDGSVARTPDSLTNVFHTRIGRTVRDGGGITPDTIIKLPDANRLTYNIVRDRWDFDFATRYAARHDSVADPSVFEIDDEIYTEFKSFIDPDKLEYDKVCELFVEQLEKTAETEGYLSDDVKATIATLKSQLKHDLDHDLDFHRNDISSYLASEILERYYSTPGAMQYSIRHSDEVNTAASILTDPHKYQAILSAPAND